MKDLTIATVLLISVCPFALSASSCIELLSENNFALYCPSYAGTLPPDIPKDKRYSKLQIESASFPYRGAFLSKENFTGLESLTYLRITSSGIERINPDSFANLKYLTYLDLSGNRLSYIEPNTFRGLQLHKLILSENLGLSLPNEALSGSKIFNFVAKDCDIHTISYELFRQTGTRHISLVNNRIRTLSDEFSVLIQPLDGSWGSIDLSNNSLVCDCSLLWLAQVLSKQRKLINSSPSEVYNLRPPLHPREIDGDEVFKPMFQLNLTCSAPKNSIQKRFLLPSEFDCPPPRVSEIDIAILGRSMESVQLTCHARGRPTPNVAWAFKQHNQEVHRIVNSPNKSPLHNRNLLNSVSIGLNVSLREFQAREFACITWTDSGLNQQPKIPNKQDSWLSGNPSSMASLIPRGPLSPEKAHRVAIRLRGLQLDSREGVPEPFTVTPNNISNDGLNGETPRIDSSELSPYHQLFIRRFTPLDLIGAILGTFVATLIILCLATRCVPRCYFKKNHIRKQALLQYTGKRATVPFSGEEQKHEGESKEQSPSQPTYFADAPTTIGSGSGPGYWPIQDYVYSSHEYDVPGLADPLAGAMPISPHPMIGAPNATGTLVRRGRPMSTASLHPSAVHTPYLFPKTATSSALLLPSVATVPPLGVVNSPFLSYPTATQPPIPVQQPPVYFSHGQQLSYGALPNGQLLLTPNLNRAMNGMVLNQSSTVGDREVVAGSDVTNGNLNKCTSEHLLEASK